MGAAFGAAAIPYWLAATAAASAAQTVTSVQDARKGRAQSRKQFAENEARALATEEDEANRARLARQKKPELIPGITGTRGIRSTQKTGPMGLTGGSGTTTLGGGLA